MGYAEPGAEVTDELMFICQVRGRPGDSLQLDEGAELIHVVEVDPHALPRKRCRRLVTIARAPRHAPGREPAASASWTGAREWVASLRPWDRGAPAAEWRLFESRGSWGRAPGGGTRSLRLCARTRSPSCSRTSRAQRFCCGAWE